MNSAERVVNLGFWDLGIPSGFPIATLAKLSLALSSRPEWQRGG